VLCKVANLFPDLSILVYKVWNSDYCWSLGLRPLLGSETQTAAGVLASDVCTVAVVWDLDYCQGLGLRQLLGLGLRPLPGFKTQTVAGVWDSDCVNP